jgi:hypothetical protein
LDFSQAEQKQIKHKQKAMKSEIPSSLRLEHEELSKRLKEFIKLRDKTGEAAKRVEKLLHAHFVRQEKYTLPPLGLLQSLAEGKLPEKMRSIVKAIDELAAKNNFRTPANYSGLKGAGRNSRKGKPSHGEAIR